MFSPEREPRSLPVWKGVEIPDVPENIIWERPKLFDVNENRDLLREKGVYPLNKQTQDIEGKFIPTIWRLGKVLLSDGISVEIDRFVVGIVRREVIDEDTQEPFVEAAFYVHSYYEDEMLARLSDEKLSGLLRTRKQLLELGSL